MSVNISQSAIAQFLASKGATVCPPTRSHTSNARSLRKMRDAHERMCGPETDMDDMDDEVREREIFGAARLNGASVSDALDHARRTLRNGGRDPDICHDDE